MLKKLSHLSQLSLLTLLVCMSSPTILAHEMNESHDVASKISKSTAEVVLPNLKVIKKDGTDVNLPNDKSSITKNPRKTWKRLKVSAHEFI